MKEKTFSTFYLRLIYNSGISILLKGVNMFVKWNLKQEHTIQDRDQVEDEMRSNSRNFIWKESLARNNDLLIFSALTIILQSAWVWEKSDEGEKTAKSRWELADEFLFSSSEINSRDLCWQYFQSRYNWKFESSFRQHFLWQANKIPPKTERKKMMELITNIWKMIWEFKQKFKEKL